MSHQNVRVWRIGTEVRVISVSDTTSSIDEVEAVMAGSVAEAFVIGNVTRDPEVKDAGATRVCHITVAHNTKYKDKEYVTYLDVTLFGKLADIAGEYVRKGSLVHIQGELREEKWDDKETGAKRSKIKIIASKIRLLGGGKGGERTSRPEPHEEEDYGNPADSSGAPF